MKSKRFIEEQIFGIKIVELCRMHGISDATFYNWRSKHGGMKVADAKRLKNLEKENRRLKHMLADTILENQAIKNVLSKKWSDSTSRWKPLPFG